MSVDSKTCCGCNPSQGKSEQPESQRKSDVQAEPKYLSNSCAGFGLGVVSWKDWFDGDKKRLTNIFF